MPIRRSSASDVARLIEELSRPDGLRRDAAAARLAVIGPRAVSRLVAFASDAGGSTQARIAALQALESIADARALTPVLELAVQGDDVGLAAVAVVGAVARGEGGQAPVARAFEWLAAAALDRRTGTATRLAALDALGGAPARHLKRLYAALAGDPDPALAARATRQAAGAIAPLQAGGGALPADPDVVSAMIREDAATIPVTELRRVVETIRARERAASSELKPGWTAARGQVHQALAARMSRVALYDVREALERATGPLPAGFLAAAAAVGDLSCLEPLAAAWVAAGGRKAEPWWRDHLAEAFRAIVRREKLTRRHPVMKRILERRPAARILVAEARK